MFPSPVGEVSNLAGVECPINSKLYYNAFLNLRKEYFVETVTMKAWDPITEQEYVVELPAREGVRQVILELDYLPDGLMNRHVAAEVAKRLRLSDEQIRARDRSQVKRSSKTGSTDTIWRDKVILPTLRKLKEEGKLEQPGGPMTPYFLPENTSLLLPVKSDLNPDFGTGSEKSIEENYQQIRKELAIELLQKISGNSPAFFEKLVIDLLVKMGYGGSHEDAQAVGRSGDGGIDGIINEDRLGLDVIYVQAKRWGNDIGEPPVRDFVGALQGKRARKGIFITTSKFSNRAREYISAIDSRDSKVILIDGEQLAQLMIDHGVGVSIEKTYEIKRVDSDYFAEDTE